MFSTFCWISDRCIVNVITVSSFKSNIISLLFYYSTTCTGINNNQSI